MLVWFIEDNPGDVFLFTQAMEQQNCGPVRIQVLRDGESAVEALDGNSAEPDLILLDLNLPKLDGFEVLERLRANKRQVPVLVLTSSESLRDMRAAYKLGASAYVTKPNNIDGVIRIVKAICAMWLEPIRLASFRPH